MTFFIYPCLASCGCSINELYQCTESALSFAIAPRTALCADTLCSFASFTLWHVCLHPLIALLHCKAHVAHIEDAHHADSERLLSASAQDESVADYDGQLQLC